MTDLETRLLSASHITFDFEVQAIGAVTAKLAGRVELIDGKVTLSYHGTFSDRQVAGRVTADATTLTCMVNEQSANHPRPTHLKQGILLGLTRMGMLHTLAQLQDGGVPAYTDGSIIEKLEMRRLRSGADSSVNFDLIVEGRHSASGALWVDGPVPTMRKQTVFFSTGGMEVEEFYRNFELR